MLLIDSHAHLTDERFSGELPGVLTRAREAGVGTIVTIGTDVADSRVAAELSVAEPDVYASAGVHPHAVAEAAPGAMADIESIARENPRVVAIGETGLDYFYDNAPRRAQRSWFSRHLELGADLDLPVVVHCREADDDTSAALRESGPATRGVLHCFAGNARLLDTALELGWYISFSGLITFSKFTGADLLCAVPLDRLLVETDSPYLAPVPHRGKRNEPAFVTRVAARAAEIRGEDPDALAAATVRNTRTLYSLEE
ncbi:MAG TPA: TatD family hydrolase [Longimicrobiaceae bacterium]|nr:TatD family hydrolase [Longimicrobiaceae bacterium]